MALTTLEEKFVYELGGIYDAEHRFLAAQEKMLPNATSPTVQALLEKHIAETEQQIVNLRTIHEILGLTAERINCDGAAGIVSEGDKLLKETKDVPALADLAINGGCSKVEHYEIAAYRGLIAGAEQMGQSEIVRLLSENLQQEENTAQNLELSVPVLLKQALQTVSQTA